MVRLKKLILIILLLGIANGLISQHFSFKNYSTQDGLAQSQVYAIAQDKQHYIWVGTLDGLSRFDGLNFKNFYVEDGLKSNTITSIYCDSITTWVGTKQGLNYVTNEKVNDIQIPELVNQKIKDIVVQNNTLVAIYGRNKIYRCKLTANYKVIDSSVFKTDIKNVILSNIQFFDNQFFISSNKGLFNLTHKGGKLVANIDNALAINNIINDSTGTVWGATMGKGILKQKKGIFTTFLNPNNSNLNSSFIRQIIIDKNQNVWASSKTGLSKISGDTIINYNKDNGFDYIPETILEDLEGNIWVGTEGKGIVRFVNESFSFINAKQGLSSDLIVSFAQDEDNNMWFSSYGNGVDVKKGNAYINYNSSNSELANNTVWCSKNYKGNLWFGSTDGLSTFKGKNIVTYTRDNGLPANKVQAIYIDYNQKMWLGTRRGLACFNTNKEQVTQQYSLTNVRSIIQTSNSLYWVATSKGLYNLKDTLLTKYQDSLLENKTIYSLATNGKKVWVGTSNGLFEISNKQVVRIDLSSTRSNFAAINFVFFDSKKTLWVGTMNGVYAIDTKTQEYNIKELGVADGLIGAETNLNAVFEDNEGKIWMGTSEGVSIYNYQTKDNSVTFKTLISLNKINFFYDSINLLETKQKTFRYNKNNITFHYHAPYFKKPSAILYSYKLEGFDENWSPAESNDFTRYANLPHGEYTFLVKAKINNKAWSNTASYSFNITPPFWLTWWFRISFLVLVFLIIYGLFRRQKIRQRERRHAEVLTYKNKLIQLEQQSLNASMNRHFIFNALNSIQFYINKEDKLSANRYLSSFAKLIRKNLDSSSSENNLISLNEELERLELYLSLEKMRFKEKFNYKIEVDPSVNGEETKVPGMFLQPFVENSIWHGILPTDSSGLIQVIVNRDDEKIIFVIEDNGIGIDTSIDNKKDELTNHTSKGMLITSNRIAILEKITGKEISLTGPYQINEGNKVLGTRVEIVFN